MHIKDLEEVQSLMPIAAYSSLSEDAKMKFLSGEGVQYPDDGSDYLWNESDESWDLV